MHIGGAVIDSPTLSIGDYYAAIANRLIIGSYQYPGDGMAFYVNGNSTLNGTATINSNTSISGTLSVACSPTNFYITSTGVNITGGLSASSNISASGLVATTSGANITGGLIVTGTTSLQALTCVGLTSSSIMSVSSGGASITGTTNIAGTCTISVGNFISMTQALFNLGTSIFVTFVNDTNILGFVPSTGSRSMGISCQSTFATNTTWIKLNPGSTGNIVCQSYTNGVVLSANATSWSATSDERLKNIITDNPYPNALDDILNIKSVRYRWKNDVNCVDQIGLIAQSVLPIIPESISTYAALEKEGDNTEYYSLRYSEVIPLLVSSVQQLTTQ